ncbi:MAG: NnrU family protein [Granulosicoccus sp.]
MLLLIVGLVLFLGVHFARVFYPQLREDFIATRGLLAYKGLYSVLSLAGLVLLVFGYGQTRLSPQFIWVPPVPMAHVASLLMLIAFVFLAAAYVPGNRIKAAVGHPMVLGVKVWALAHLLANGRLGDIVLFGAFLVWAVILYVRSRKIDRAQGGVISSANSIARDSITVVVGIGVWLIFAMWAHVRLIGVSPFGG